MKNAKAILIVAAAVLLSIFLRLEVFTLPIQGKDMWRQSKTAWNIRYFIRQDANILNPRQPFLNDGDNIVRYEFPIMQWSIAMVEKITGEHILVERIIVYLFSLLTLLAVFKLALLFTEDILSAALSVWAFAFMPTFFYNATSIMPDLLGLCFGMWYTFFFFRHVKSGKTSDLILSGVFIALAGLTKLPFILLGTFSLLRFFELAFAKHELRWQKAIRFGATNALALIPVIAWYKFVIPGWTDNNITEGMMKSFVGWPLFIEFLKNHIYVNFPMEILNYAALILLFVGIFYSLREGKIFFVRKMYFYIPLLILFIYFFYILNVIREGHEYYFMPFYPVFMLCIILGLHRGLHWKGIGKGVAWALLIAMPILCWNREKDYWDPKFAYFNPDFFTCRDQLSAIGTNTDKAIVINDESLSIFLYIIDKEGFVFWNNNLPVLWIKDIIKREHAQYLYSDSRAIEEQEGFDTCISEIILECGSIKVFKLKSPDEIQM